MENSIINKIQKLLAKAESAEEIGNLEEAAAFSAKVNELLMKHNLQMADLDTEEESEVTHTEIEAEDLSITKQKGGWTINLMTTLCGFNFCKPLYNTSFDLKIRDTARGAKLRKKKKVDGVIIIGKHENVEVVKYLYTVMKSENERLGKSGWSNYLKEQRANVLKAGYAKDSMYYKKPWNYQICSRRGAWLKSFYLGANNGIRQRLQEQHEAAKQSHGVKVTDLVLVNDAALEDYIKITWGTTSTMSNRSIVIVTGKR